MGKEMVFWDGQSTAEQATVGLRPYVLRASGSSTARSGTIGYRHSLGRKERPGMNATTDITQAPSPNGRRPPPLVETSVKAEGIVPRWTLLALAIVLAAFVAAISAAPAEAARSEPPPPALEEGDELSGAAASNQWLDGQIGYTYLDHFYLGHITLTGQYVGYWGSLDGTFPRVGDVYWGHIVVYNVSTMPIIVYPEVKLPPNTKFAVSSSAPIRSFVNGTEVSDGPRAPGQSDYQVGYWSLKPSDPSRVWGLQDGGSLEIWFPLVSSVPLNGEPLQSAVAPLSSAGTVTPTWGTSSGPVYVYARPDVTAPRVISVVPSAGATGVARKTNVVATFSEQVDKSTITKSSFKLYKVSATGTTQITNVTVTPNQDGTKATLNPYGTSATLLAKNTRYKAVLTTGVRDLAGNAMAANKVWYFKTAS
jgi:hypothetical protein